MSELLKKQNYGVEVEFTGISRKMAADAVAEIIGTTASRPDRTCYQIRTIQDSQGRKWKVMRDSSINPIRKVGTENMDEYRVEFVTPVLKYEDLETLQAIIRKFREIGGVPHASCGIHIHVDGANHLFGKEQDMAVIAIHLSPSTSCAVFKRNVESTPLEKATATLPRLRKYSFKASYLFCCSLVAVISLI